MTRDYRRIVILAVGWLVLTAAQQPQNGENAKRARVEQSVTDSLSDIARSQREANKPREQERPCRIGEDNHASDLCAQWKAANAASDAAYWSKMAVLLSVVQLALGALGTWLLWHTLRATRAAVEDTSEATQQMKRSNEIAQDALADARKGSGEQAAHLVRQIEVAERNAAASVAMQRPWLKLRIRFREPISFNSDGATNISYEVIAENAGNNPALNVRLVSKPRPFEMSEEYGAGILDVRERAAAGWSNHPIIFPGDSFSEGGYTGPVASRDIGIYACAAYQIDGSETDHFTAISFRAPLVADNIFPDVFPEGRGYVT